MTVPLFVVTLFFFLYALLQMSLVSADLFLYNAVCNDLDMHMILHACRVMLAEIPSSCKFDISIDAQAKVHIHENRNRRGKVSFSCTHKPCLSS